MPVVSWRDDLQDVLAWAALGVVTVYIKHSL